LFVTFESSNIATKYQLAKGSGQWAVSNKKGSKVQELQGYRVTGSKAQSSKLKSSKV
jgi:hypothetical protein